VGSGRTSVNVVGDGTKVWVVSRLMFSVEDNLGRVTPVESKVAKGLVLYCVGPREKSNQDGSFQDEKAECNSAFLAGSLFSGSPP